MNEAKQLQYLLETIIDNDKVMCSGRKPSYEQLLFLHQMSVQYTKQALEVLNQLEETQQGEGNDDK